MTQVWQVTIKKKSVLMKEFPNVSLVVMHSNMKINMDSNKRVHKQTNNKQTNKQTNMYGHLKGKSSPELP